MTRLGYLYRCRVQSKDLVACSLCVAVHVDEDVNAVLVYHVRRLPIARHLTIIHQTLIPSTHTVVSFYYYSDLITVGSVAWSAAFCT